MHGAGKEEGKRRQVNKETLLIVGRKRISFNTAIMKSTPYTSIFPTVSFVAPTQVVDPAGTENESFLRYGLLGGGNFCFSRSQPGGQTSGEGDKEDERQISEVWELTEREMKVMGPWKRR